MWSVLNCVVFIFRYKAGNVQPGEVSQSEPEDRGGWKELRRARRGAWQRSALQTSPLHEGEITPELIPLINVTQPPSSYITAGQKIEIPLGCQELHHEIELGVVISKNCKRVSPDQAMDYVGGYCLALDMTARDFQVCLDCFKSLASYHQCTERGQV